MVIGISIGVAIGAATNNIPKAMCLGLSIGLCLGAGIDVYNRQSENISTEKETEEKDSKS